MIQEKKEKKANYRTQKVQPCVSIDIHIIFGRDQL